MSTPQAVIEFKLPSLVKFPRRSGKVREVFDLGDKLAIIASDRISAFDHILPTGIPGKGQVLNSVSAFWFETLEEAQPHHLLASNSILGPKLRCDFQVQLESGYGIKLALPEFKQVNGRAMLAQKTLAIPVECVVRGYLVGSGWKDYRATGSVCGISLPDDLQIASKLDHPIFTPATKAMTGHDENISFEDAVRVLEKFLGEHQLKVGVTPGELAGHLREWSLRLYTAGLEYALDKGVILADTKFEFGILPDRTIILIDEILTPDSSRFWKLEEWQPGQNPNSFDKQHVRDYLDLELGWNREPPVPELTQKVVVNTRARYLEIAQRLSGQDMRM